MTGDSLWLRCLFTYFLTRIGLQSCFSPFFPSLRRPLEMDTVSVIASPLASPPCELSSPEWSHLAGRGPSLHAKRLWSPLGCSEAGLYALPRPACVLEAAQGAQQDQPGLPQ